MDERRQAVRDERGSALVLAMLVAFVLTLLGISFLWFAETERFIAKNEQLAVQARYLANGGVRIAKRWFDTPGNAPLFPPIGAVDRSQRLVDRDGDGPLAPETLGGSLTPYKQAIDLDGDTTDDIFRRPFRGGDVHTLLGTEAGPDMVIDYDLDASRTFLDELSLAIAPELAAGCLQGRIARIEFFGPRYVSDGVNWVRMGMGRMRVTSQLRRCEGGDTSGIAAGDIDDPINGPQFEGLSRVVAERTVQVALNEMPYRGAFGPLHSCAGIDWSEDFGARWGAVTSMTGGDLPDPDPLDPNPPIPRSIVRSVPGDPRNDSVYGLPFGFGLYRSEIDGRNVDDPWLRILSGGRVFAAPGVQPWATTWSPGGSNEIGFSSLFQGLAFVGCPVYDYDLWKDIAGEGYRDTRYFTWDAGANGFREDGVGPATSFQALTDQQSGVFFFDTIDARPPRDANSDGAFDNLTPPISITSGNWSFQGVLYLNAESFQVAGATGRSATFRAPGEPYFDEDGDGNLGLAELAADRWVNLDYPTTLTGTFRVDETDGLRDDGSIQTGAVANERGPAITANANVVGVLYTNGRFESRGASRYFGSVIARGGVAESGGAVGRAEIYWDERLVDDWPPATWDVPRTVTTEWLFSP